MRKNRKAKARSKNAAGEPDSLAKDMEQLGAAMARVKDPMMRYMLTMVVEMASERIAQLEEQTRVAGETGSRTTATLTRH